MKNLKPKFVISKFLVGLATALTLSVAIPIRAATPKSGVYLTAADYKEGRLAFKGDCNSKAHGLELHDILNKPYIDVTHESEKRRYSKSDYLASAHAMGATIGSARSLNIRSLNLETCTSMAGKLISVMGRALQCYGLLLQRGTRQPDLFINAGEP